MTQVEEYKKSSGSTYGGKMAEVIAPGKEKTSTTTPRRGEGTQLIYTLGMSEKTRGRGNQEFRARGAEVWQCGERNEVAQHRRAESRGEPKHQAIHNNCSPVDPRGLGGRGRITREGYKNPAKKGKGKELRQLDTSCPGPFNGMGIPKAHTVGKTKFGDNTLEGTILGGTKTKRQTRKLAVIG